MKCYWQWLVDMADHAGFVEYDDEVAAFQINTKVKLPTPDEAFPNQVIKHGDKYFLVSFIRFQYGENLNPNNNAHKGVLKLLKKNNLDPAQLASLEAQGSSTGASQDKEQEQEPDKVKVQEQEKLPFDSPEFAEAWADWRKHRTEIKKKLTPTSVKQQLKSFAENGEEWAIQTIRYTIEKGWQGLVPPDHLNNAKPSHRSAKASKEYAEPETELPML